MKVPILKIPFSKSDLAFIEENTRKVLLSGVLTMGPYTAEFEKSFASFSDSTHAIATSSATSAIEIIIRALGIEDRAIVVPTNTFFATALAVMHSGNRVDFLDSDPATMCLDANALEAYLKEAKEVPAAVILVHIGGNMSRDTGRIEDLCQSRGIHLIEDCAHAHGCSIDGRMAGTIGVAGAFSFFPTKVLVTGEGGIITTNDDELAEKARSLRNHGKNEKGEIAVPGSNWRMSEVTAVIGCEQMRCARHIVDSRSATARKYDDLLAGVENIRRLEVPGDVFSSYYKYIAFLDNGIRRDDLKTRMKERGVSLTGEVYACMCHEEPVWRSYDAAGRRSIAGINWMAGGRRFPGADAIKDRHICLPLYPDMTDDEVIFVVRTLKECIGELRKGA